MDNQKVINQTRSYLKDKFGSNTKGHDFWHLQRVVNLSMEIARHEQGVDLFVLELTALLHDIDDWKFNGGDDSLGPKKARHWLESQNVNPEKIEQIVDTISWMSFHKGSEGRKNIKRIEAKIVHDADKLDAMGAIGIARLFVTGAYFNEIMHDPSTKPDLSGLPKTKPGSSSIINHFHEKLLLLKDLMFTETAKEIAKERHRYMEDFLKEFYAEWDGKQ